MLTIISYPLSIGNGPMKSNAIDSNILSGTGNGCNGPGGHVIQDLFYWHSGHDGMYPSINFFLMFSQ